MPDFIFILTFSFTDVFLFLCVYNTLSFWFEYRGQSHFFFRWLMQIYIEQLVTLSNRTGVYHKTKFGQRDPYRDCKALWKKKRVGALLLFGGFSCVYWNIDAYHEKLAIKFSKLLLPKMSQWKIHLDNLRLMSIWIKSW